MTAPENEALSDDELARLEHGALYNTARGYDRECSTCSIEAPLVVRLAVEVRRWRERGGSIECPVPSQCIKGPGSHTHNPAL